MAYVPTLGAIWTDWFTPKKWRYIDAWTQAAGVWEKLSAQGPIKMSDKDATATVIDLHETYWSQAPLVRLFTWEDGRWTQS